MAWIDKEAQPKLNRKGMALKFILPVIDNGNIVAQLDSSVLEELTNVWDRFIILYVDGEKPSLERVLSYVRKQWNHVAEPRVYPHDDEYFIIRFTSEEECNEIMQGGPYFMAKSL